MSACRATTRIVDAIDPGNLDRVVAEVREALRPAELVPPAQLSNEDTCPNCRASQLPCPQPRRGGTGAVPGRRRGGTTSYRGPQ
jgi:hypothetical protein